MAKASKWVYETVAEAIRSEHEAWSSGSDHTTASSYAILRSLASKTATQFAADNPRFDADKFVKACGF